MSKLTGKATVSIDGTTYKMANKVTFDPGGVSRKPEVHGGRTYYPEEEMPPSLECEVLHDKDADIIALGDISDATVLIECDTKQKFIMRHAFTTEPIKADFGNGKGTLKMSGDMAEKV